MRGIVSITVAVVLLAMPLSGATGWLEERELAPYLIRSEFALRDVADLVNDLGDLQADLERLLNLKCEPREIQIHLFRSRSSYTSYLSQRVPEGVKRQALFVQGTDAGRVYAYRQRDLDTDVRHETTHALMHSALPYVPLWLDEGIAEYFEMPPGLREKQHPHRRELQNAIRFGWKPNLEKLEAEGKMLDMNGRDYRDAWGVVHFLLHGPKAARDALADYFEEIESGSAPKPLSRHLRSRFPDLERQIVEHLKGI